MQKEQANNRARQGGYLLLLVILVCVALWGGRMYAARQAEAEDSTKTVVQRLAEDRKVLTEEELVEKVLGSMSLTEKLGQMMIVGIRGKAVDEDSLYQLHQFHFGGIILFDRNMESMDQVRSLTGSLQEQCEEKLPLFIALDEEGGKVARMKEALPPPPSQREIGSSGQPALAEKYAVSTAQALKSIGINVNFAPVADIGDLGAGGSRYYSLDARETAKFVDAAAKGYENSQLYYALKHFPGIGKGKTDSHFDSVVIDVSKEELLAEDVLPFKAIIDNHNAENYFVMVSHSTYPQLAGDTPASLAPEIMAGLLRRELGYRGVIITDDMEMGAAARQHSFRKLGLMAVQAGADIVLVCHDYEHETDVYMGMLEAVKDGRLSEERVNESVRRIIKMKLHYLV